MLLLSLHFSDSSLDSFTVTFPNGGTQKGIQFHLGSTGESAQGTESTLLTHTENASEAQDEG